MHGNQYGTTKQDVFEAVKAEMDDPLKGYKQTIQPCNAAYGQTPGTTPWQTGTYATSTYQPTHVPYTPSPYPSLHGSQGYAQGHQQMGSHSAYPPIAYQHSPAQQGPPAVYPQTGHQQQQQPLVHPRGAYSYQPYTPSYGGYPNNTLTSGTAISTAGTTSHPEWNAPPRVPGQQGITSWQSPANHNSVPRPTTDLMADAVQTTTAGQKSTQASSTVHTDVIKPRNAKLVSVLSTADHIPVVKPKNIAWVIIQGGILEADRICLYEALNGLGFQQQDVRILHKETDTISLIEAKRHLIAINEEMAPGANFLIMVVSQQYAGIEFESSFLVKEIYRSIARFNNDREKEWQLAYNRHVMKQHYMKNTFDPRPYDGITLHVVLDGVAGPRLPQILSGKSFGGDYIRGPPATWIPMPQDAKTKQNEGQIGLRMKTGRIVQLWSDWSKYGHRPCALFNGFISLVLNEPYIPYNVLLHKIEVLSRVPLAAIRVKDEEQRSVCHQRRSSGIAPRLVGETELVISLAHTAKYCAQRYLEYKDYANKEMWEGAVASGKAIFSSVNMFDPHLTLRFEWNE